MTARQTGDRFWRVLGLGVLLAGLAAAGCSPQTGTVKGTVTYNGEILGTGSIAFIGKDGKRGVAAIKGEGNYTCIGAPVGSVKIIVQTSPPPPKDTMERPKDMPVIKMPGEDRQEQGKYVKIPEKYADESQTPLTYEVKKGKQTHDIELTD